MRNFIYLIGSADDFESITDLVLAYRADVHRDAEQGNMSVYPVSLSEGTTVKGYRNLEEIATIIGYGEAMMNGWCLDDTVSILLEG